MPGRPAVPLGGVRSFGPWIATARAAMTTRVFGSNGSGASRFMLSVRVSCDRLPAGKGARVEARSEQERFVTEANPSLVAALTHQFGDRWLAEELAQEALVRACDRWSSVRGLDSPIGWTFRVAVNLGRSTLRRRAAEGRARVRRGDERLVHHDPDVALQLVVRDALCELTELQRQAVVLRHFLGLSAAQTARVLESTEDAVRALTSRGIARLRVSLPEATRSEVPDGP